MLPEEYYLDSGQYIIYVLIDPRNNAVKYIGKSCSGLRRVRQHFVPSQLKNRTKKTSWIKSLLKQDLYPVVNILKQTNSRQELSSLEKSFIAQYRNNGIDLLNMTLGGDGECYIASKNKQSWNKGKKENRKSVILRMKNAKIGRKTRPRTTDEKEKIRISNVIAHQHQCKPFKCLQNNIIYNSQKEAADDLNLNPANISGVLNKHKKATGGYSFIFVDEGRCV